MWIEINENKMDLLGQASNFQVAIHTITNFPNKVRILMMKPLYDLINVTKPITRNMKSDGCVGGFGQLGSCQKHIFNLIDKRIQRLRQYKRSRLHKNFTVSSGENRDKGRLWLKKSIEAEEKLPPLMGQTRGSTNEFQALCL